LGLDILGLDILGIRHFGIRHSGNDSLTHTSNVLTKYIKAISQHLLCFP